MAGKIKQLKKAAAPAPKPIPAARPIFKPVLKLAGALFAGLGLALYFYMSSGLFQSHVLSLINARIPGTLSWEALDLSLAPLRLTARHLVLNSPAGKPVACIAGLDITMDRAGLAAGTLRFPSIKITAPLLTLDLPAHGRDSLTAALIKNSGGGSAGPSGLPFNLGIENMLIEDGQLDLTLPDANRPRKKLILDQLRLNISGDMDPKGVTGLNLAAEIPGIRFTAAGSIAGLFEAPVPDMTAELVVETRTAAQILRPWLDTLARMPRTDTKNGGTIIDGPATLKLTVTGPLDNPAAQASLALGPGSILGQPVTSARLSARLENRRITLAPSGLILPNQIFSNRVFSSPKPGPGPFELEGSLDLAPMFPRGFTGETAGTDNLAYTLAIRHKNLPLEWVASILNLPLESLKHLSGSLAPVLRVTGRGITPGRITAEIQAEADARDIRSPLLALPAALKLNASAKLQGQELDITFLSLAGPGLSVKGEGKLGLAGRDPSLAAGLTLSAPDLSLPAHHLGVDLAGSARLSVTAKGTLAQPRLIANLEAGNLSAAGIRADTFSASAEVTPENLVIREAILSQATGTEAATGRLRAEGRIGFGQDLALALDLTAEEMDLAGLMPDREIQGRISGRISAGGTLASPRAEARITGEGLGIGEIPLGRIDSEVSLSQNGLSQNILTIARTELIRGSARMAADGQINLKDRTMDININAPELNLAALPGLAGQASGRADLALDLKGSLAEPALNGRIRAKNLKTAAFPDLAGALSADFHAQGPISNPGLVNARAGLHRLTIIRDGRPLLELEDAALSLENRQLRLSPVPLLLMGQGRVTLEGRLDPEGNLTASARGSIPLALAPDLTEAVQSASGDIRLSVSAAGPVSRPDIRGDLSFTDLNLVLEALPTPVQNIRGKIRFSPEKIKIEQVAATLGDGQIRLKGTTGLVQGRPNRFALNLEAFRLPLDIPDTLDLSVNSRLTLAGTPEKSRLSGTVDLLEGRYYKNLELNLKDLAPRKTRQTPPAGSDTGPEFLKAMALNIHIRRREPLLVDNNLARLTVSPDLTLRGTAHTPILSGRAQVDEGTIIFQKAKFNVTGGIVDFVNPYKLEPEIDVTGETTIRSWTITVKMAGAPDDLRLSFSSDPSEPDADILSLITLGKTTREMASAQNGARMAGAGAAAGLIAGPMGKKLKEATGLDEVDIRMDDSGDKAGVKITLGADLSRKLSVAYGMDIKDGETVQQVTTYYKLLEHLLMSGFQDTSGRFGGGLKYRLEFR